MAIASRVTGAVAKGSTFAAALAAQGLPPARPIKLRRLDAVQQKSVPAAVMTFLTMPAGTTRALPGTDGTSGAAVCRQGSPPAIRRPAARSWKRPVSSWRRVPRDELAGAFARAVGREVGVKLNPAAIAATRARILGDAGQAK